MCVRPRCRRMKDLNKYKLCGGHACPVPDCQLSKSSTEKLCETHTAMRVKPTPKQWLCIELEGGIPVFLNMKLFVAQYEHPGPKLEFARERKSKRKLEKPKKGYPLLFR